MRSGSVVMWLGFCSLVLGASGCQEDCATGQERCHGQCTDITSDRTHCGACDKLCEDNQYCSAGQCVPCDNECLLGQKQCVDHDGIQYQQCEVDEYTCHRWSVPRGCQDGFLCRNGECVDSPPCTDECNRPDAKICDASRTGFRICGDFDEDICLDWGPLNACQDGLICLNGSCISDCRDQCKLGERRCAEPPDNGFWQCGNYDADSCVEWGGLVLCPEGETCQDGTCSTDCKDECSQDQRTCEDNGFRTCGQFDPDSCLDWSSATECASYEMCLDGQCSDICRDECAGGTKQCAEGQNGWELCGNFDPDPCLEWGSYTACTNGTLCLSGACKDDCVSDCPAQGVRACIDDGYKLCGNFDGDSCLEWSETIPCSDAETCVDGQCVESCKDECTEGDRRCAPPDNGFDICGDYDADSCTEWGGLTLCPTDQTCSNGACGTGCSDECTSGQRVCDDGGFRVCGQYDADACLDLSAVTQCAAWETCHDGTCVVICKDECQAQTKRCAGDGFDVCGLFDSDPCLEWGGHTSCPYGTRCESGICVEDCRDECPTQGERICDGAGYRICDQFDGDSCLELSEVADCEEGLTCSNGICSAVCQNECFQDQRECYATGWRECGQYDSDACLDFSPITACQSWEICSPTTVTCVSNCTDACSPSGSQQCSGNGFVVCGDTDADPCLEWGGVQPCPDGQVCDPAAGQCIDDCDDQCGPSGVHQCSTNGFDVCGNYDSDACLEWGGHQACPDGTSCSNGECQAACSDECLQAGQRICDGTIGFRTCGEYDEDDCLDLSDLSYCAYNQECQGGTCVQICTDTCPVAGAHQCQGDQLMVCGDSDADPCLEWVSEQICQTGKICFAGACISENPPATVLINEILYDDEGVDGEYVFIELWGPAGLSLDNFSLAGINGHDGERYMQIDLTGYSLPSNGHFLIAGPNTAWDDPPYSFEIDLTSAAADLQNGPDSLQVLWADSRVVDALGYEEPAAGEVFAGEGQPAPSADHTAAAGLGFCLSRGMDHKDTDNNLDDFTKRVSCSPGWAGPGAIAWSSYVWGGSSTPAVDVNGYIYTVDSYGWINTINPEGQGEDHQPTSPFRSSVSLTNDNPPRLYVGSDSGLVILSVSYADGVAWPKTEHTLVANRTVASTPAIGPDGDVYFGTRGGGLVAGHPDGSEKWRYASDHWTIGSYPDIDSSPAVGALGMGDEQLVVFGTGAGEVIAVAADSGAEVWYRTEPDGACDSSPALGSNGRVYIGCDDGFLYAFDGVDGTPLPDFPLYVAQDSLYDESVEGCSPVVVPAGDGGDLVTMTSHADGNNLYVLHYDGDQVTGWMETLSSAISSGAHLADGSVLVHWSGLYGNYLDSYTPEGDLQWYTKLNAAYGSSGWLVSSPTPVPGGLTYVIDTGTGMLYAVRTGADPVTESGAFPMFHGDWQNSGTGF